MKPSYDVIVIGTGGVGSAALYHLAKRGVRVLGLDQFEPPHELGSSHGRTRVIRQAYFEHPDYVPLLLRAYQLWDELSAVCGESLYHEVGVLEVGPPDGIVVPGVLTAAHQHKLNVERLTAAEARARFPQFTIPDDWQAAFEQRAGYLDVEACVSVHLSAAQQRGASLETQTVVRGWRPLGSGVQVETDRGAFEAAKLVIAAGPWTASILSSLHVRLEVKRKPVFWYPPNSAALRADRGCPCYLFETSGGIFYGIPQVDEFGFKVAEHSGGNVVQDPGTVDRSLDPADQSQVEAFLSAHIPDVGRPTLHHSVCLYTMSPDENFIVDLHPDYPQVAFAAGLSGHGFKFTSVLGQALADLALEGKTDLPIGFLTCRRFARPS